MRATTLIQIAIDMQKAPLSLDEIETKYEALEGKSSGDLTKKGEKAPKAGDQAPDFASRRRSAERARDAIRDIWGELEETRDDEDRRKKRWRLPPGKLDKLVSVQADELQELQLAADRLEVEGLNEKAGLLRMLRAKIEAVHHDGRKVSVQNNVADLLEAEGLAMRPGARPNLSLDVVEALRQAILCCSRLKITYRKRIGNTLDEDPRVIDVDPYGLLFGEQHYLVAYPAGSTEQLPRLYALPNIIATSVAKAADGKDAFFERRSDFNLREFSERSFGVFQEEQMNVVLRFHSNRAADVHDYFFHPTQQKTDLEDGSVEVRFTACGQREMAWNFFRWGKDVKVVAPDDLRKYYQEMLAEAQSSLVD